MLVHAYFVNSPELTRRDATVRHQIAGGLTHASLLRITISDDITLPVSTQQAGSQAASGWLLNDQVVLLY
jgi:hypothetical protein